MISFKDFLTTTPNIQCDITRGKQNIFEDLHAEPFQFLIPKEDDEKYPGDIIAPGVMNIQKFGKPDTFLVQRHGGHKPIEFNNQEAALNFRDMERERHGKEVEAIHSKLMQHYAGVHINAVHSDALAQYVKSSYGINNRLLLKHSNSSFAIEKEYAHNIHRMENATHARHTPDMMIVYSGISADHAEKLNTANLVHHPAFLSTSLSLSTARGFSHGLGSNSVMKIHVPPDHPGVYVGDAAGKKHAEEREFILPRGLNIRIHRDKEKILKTQDGDFRVHHCTIE